MIKEMIKLDEKEKYYGVFASLAIALLLNLFHHGRSYCRMALALLRWGNSFALLDFPNSLISTNENIQLLYCFRWNSWNHFQCNIEEKLIRETGDSIHSINQCFLI